MIMATAWLAIYVQVSLANPDISNPPKNSLGTNGGGLTRSDCISLLSLIYPLVACCKGKVRRYLSYGVESKGGYFLTSKSLIDNQLAQIKVTLTLSYFSISTIWKIIEFSYLHFYQHLWLSDNQKHANRSWHYSSFPLIRHLLDW